MSLNRTVFTLLAAASALSANTVFTLGADHNQNYGGLAVGPYYGTLTGSAATMFFCLDQDLGSVWNNSYTGSVHTPNTAAEEEAAFLASYSLSHGAPGSSVAEVNNVEGPVSMAIWQLMSTLETPPDPKAQPLIAMAQSAYSQSLITPSYLSHVLIFQPDNAAVQRFIAAYRDDIMVNSAETPVGAVPEAATFVLFGGGLALFAALHRRLLASRPRP